MNILFATSECAPFSKSGGLADVAYSLPPALLKSGNQVAVITPLYACVRNRFADQLSFVRSFNVTLGASTVPFELYKGENCGVPMWFVAQDGLFDREKLYGYDDDKWRFAYFSRAVIDLIMELDFVPDILHCNDWETAPAVIYLKNDQAWRQDIQNIRSVYTIHNIAYQGQFAASDLEAVFALDGGWYQGGLGYEYEGRHDINLMKGAMLMADAVSTVSPTYATELHSPEFGHGLEGVADTVEYKMYGILNGIDMDLYDPMKDTRLPHKFSAKDLAGKAACKKALQEKFQLDQHKDWPLLCSVARLVEQKGIELIKEILPSLMEMGVQLIIFGQGEQRYIDYFEEMCRKYPRQLGFSSNYSEEVAAEVFAGSDMYLMPSRFEPCGLSQMMAMRYGTVPIVHETGGLKDSVRPYSSFDGIGDGFSFRNYDAKSLYLAILSAVRVYFGEPDVFNTLRLRCMTKDFSWDKSAEQYDRMFSEISDSNGGEAITFNDAFKNLKKEYVKAYKNTRKRSPELFNENYHLAVQVHISGRGEGIFYVEITDEDIKIEPYTFHECDAQISASYDNLMGMVKGTVSADRLFMNGQFKVSGNISRGSELRWILTNAAGRRKITKA